MNKTTILSYGGGQDSTAILYKIIYDKQFREKYIEGDLIVVMADTKNEHEHTIEYVEKVKGICFENKIEFYHLKPEEYASNYWKLGLVGFYKEKKVVGSKAFPKTCTDNLKIRPIYKFVEKYIHSKYSTKHHGRKRATYEYKERFGKLKVIIGIAEKEEKRASENGSSGMKWFDECIEKTYPLIEEGMDRKDCQEYIVSVGQEVPFPSNCILCPFMSLQELLYLYRTTPFWFDEWVSIEAEKIKANTHKKDKNLGVWGTRKLLPEMLKKAIQLHGYMTNDELKEYKMSHGHCVMSKY